jgi:hypothetical protein
VSSQLKRMKKKMRAQTPFVIDPGGVSSHPN